MKRKYILLFLTIILSLNTQAQVVVGIANYRYENLNYSGAIPFLKSLIKNEKYQNNPDVIKKLAISYKLTNQNQLAEPQFFRLAQIDPSIDHKRMYLESMIENKKYDAALSYMNEQKLYQHNDVRINEIYASLINYNELMNLNEDCYAVFKLPLNTKNESDFAPSYYSNGIVFASTRTRSDIVGRKHLWTNRNYTSLYYASYNDGYKKTEKFAKNLSGKYNFGPATFHLQSKTMYYSVNNQKRKSIDGYKNLMINSAKFDLNKEEWVKNNLFQYNGEEYACTHPCLNAKATKLYFSSDMPNGLGGMDIYVCEWIDSMWSTPRNLGPSVNTPNDEVFPFIWNDSILYFASNGRGGLGGLDLFSYELNSTKKAENLGSPFNSFADDFAYIREARADNGYFSSSRGNYGINDDIYSFKKVKNKSLNVQVKVIDERNDSIIALAQIKVSSINVSPNVEISLKNMETTRLDLNFNYNFLASATGYESNSIQKKIQKADTLIIIPLKKIYKGCIVKGNISNKYTKQNLDSVLVSIVNNSTNEVEFKTITDATGNYKFTGLKGNTSYTINVERRGYLAQSTYLSTVGNACTFNTDRESDYTVDFKLISDLLGKKIVIENIYFDLNKHNIRPDAAIELEKIVKVMNENPEIIIELSSHTDSRGSDKYNLALSDRRAKSSASYIVSKGISRSRIYGVGKGEKELINECINGVVCTEELHQKNRRTEFKIVGFQMKK